jgi:hypothetical protein
MADSILLMSACKEKSGSYEVAIIEGDTGRQIVVGEFRVTK